MVSLGQKEYHDAYQEFPRSGKELSGDQGVYIF
jgi:hypothetical protein